MGGFLCLYYGKSNVNNKLNKQTLNFAKRISCDDIKKLFERTCSIVYMSSDWKHSKFNGQFIDDINGGSIPTEL